MKLLACFFILLGSNLAFAHEATRMVIDLGETAEVPTLQAGEHVFRFSLIDTKNESLITPSDLATMDTKILHVFIFDSALKEFRHLHPEYINSKWQVTSVLPQNGKYWIWAEGELLKDATDFTGPAQFVVEHGTPENVTTPDLGDSRMGMDGSSMASLMGEPVKAKVQTVLKLEFSETDGSTPILTPYLGEAAHVLIASSDGDSIIHAHPMMVGKNLEIHAEFPEAGVYRVWIQFVDGGVLKVIPLSVLVTE